MFLEVIILARRISSEGRLVFWFGGSSILFSWHEHFSVLATKSETSMMETPTVGMGKVQNGKLLIGNFKVYGEKKKKKKETAGGGRKETSFGERGKGEKYYY